MGEYILNQLELKSFYQDLKNYETCCINKKVVIKNFKRYRVFMTSVVAALSFGKY